MIENLIHRRRAEKDLTNDTIAASMTAALGKKVSPEAVGHYFTGTAGIPLEKLGAFLESIGLKVVRNDEVFVSPEKLQALNYLAKEALVISSNGDVRKSRRG